MKKDLEHTFVGLIEEHQNIIHKISRLYTNTAEEREDLFQEITLQLWKAFPKFRGDSKFSTWMYRVALNTAITLYRKSIKQVKTNSLDDIPFSFLEQKQEDDFEEKIAMLYKAIKQLSEIERAIILLYLEDKPYKEVSILLGISEVNARVKMNRAKNKLKKILNL